MGTLIPNYLLTFAEDLQSPVWKRPENPLLLI